MVMPHPNPKDWTHATTSTQLDEKCRQGCSDPTCTVPPEDHEEFYFTPKCHPEQKQINVFYDRIMKEVCCVCPICHRGIIKVKVA